MFDVSGSLRLTIDGQDVDVTADGSTLRAEVGRPRRLLRSFGLRFGSASLLRRLTVALDRYEMTLVVTQRGATIARLGSGVRSGFVGWLLRVPYLRFHRK